MQERDVLKDVPLHELPIHSRKTWGNDVFVYHATGSVPAGSSTDGPSSRAPIRSSAVVKESVPARAAGFPRRRSTSSSHFGVPSVVAVLFVSCAAAPFTIESSLRV